MVSSLAGCGDLGGDVGCDVGGSFLRYSPNISSTCMYTYKLGIIVDNCKWLYNLYKYMYQNTVYVSNTLCQCPVTYNYDPAISRQCKLSYPNLMSCNKIIHMDPRRLVLSKCSHFKGILVPSFSNKFSNM